MSSLNLPVNRALLLLALCAFGFLATGCNVASGVAYFVTPNPTVEAQYEIRDIPTVIFVDDRRNTVNPVRFRRLIAETASQDLLDEELVNEVFSPRDADLAARKFDRGSTPVEISRIAEAVEAKQIIYVEMIQFVLSRDGVSPDPYASCNIRVLDLEQRKQVFPDKKELSEAGEFNVEQTVSGNKSYTLQVSLPSQTSQGLTDARVRQKLGESLAEETGHRIAKLFYEHEIPAVGANLIYQ
ncbi:MAG: hypothetical protein CMJ39_05355 [Phycisphaerae bacterium]|nr:hypothetical protein [Phycisphaerae bacterium]